jgi:hypothetical protein
MDAGNAMMTLETMRVWRGASKRVEEGRRPPTLQDVDGSGMAGPGETSMNSMATPCDTPMMILETLGLSEDERNGDGEEE